MRKVLIMVGLALLLTGCETYHGAGTFPVGDGVVTVGGSGHVHRHPGVYNPGCSHCNHPSVHYDRYGNMVYHVDPYYAANYRNFYDPTTVIVTPRHLCRW